MTFLFIVVLEIVPQKMQNVTAVHCFLVQTLIAFIFLCVQHVYKILPHTVGIKIRECIIRWPKEPYMKNTVIVRVGIRRKWSKPEPNHVFRIRPRIMIYLISVVVYSSL